MKKILLISVMPVLLWSYFLTAQTPVKPLPEVKADKVVVYKSERKMQLLCKDKVIRTYTVTLGRDPIGHKVKKGDNRTPEGNYTLDWRNPNSSWHKSLHISYPSKSDKAKAKSLGVSPGGDVMIHGLHPSISMLGSKHTGWDWTYGCIAVTNEEMDEIWVLVKNGTPIEIRK
jgi:murein L,D-transpeptidase YafK